MAFHKTLIFNHEGDNGLGFIFSPTNTINCCNVNALGYECVVLSSGIPAGIDGGLFQRNSPTDDFGSLDLYQTIILVVSNLVLLLPAFKAALLGNWSRVFLNFMAMIFSMWYHLCKTKSVSGGICVLNFCTLKNLDYSFSNTLEISLIFFLFPFIIEEEEDYSTKERLHSKKDIFIRKYAHIESFILISFFFIIFILLDSTFFCSGQHSMALFLIMSGSALLITLIGHCIITRLVFVSERIQNNYWGEYYANWNRVNFIVGTIFAILAVGFFIVEDYISKDYYWITHSLWHILAALAQVFYLDIRSKKRTGMAALLFICIPT